jgi:hypothetical protein
LIPLSITWYIPVPLFSLGFLGIAFQNAAAKIKKKLQTAKKKYTKVHKRNRPFCVLIQSEGGILKVEGVDDGTQVAVYTPDGKQAGSAVCRNGAALVGTSIQPGNTAIVKIGEKSVKVIVK